MIRELTDDCVHCGFCLPTCPTYLLWNEEMDSPRGRIHLMDALLDGTVALNRTVVEHFDRCLGCLACVSSCPSGVQYGRLIEATRETVEREFVRGKGERLQRALLFSVLPYPRRMRLALALAPLGRRVPLPKRIRAMVEIAPPWHSTERVPPVTPATGEVRGRVGMLLGCVQQAVFGDVNAATARVLAAEGLEVSAPPQGCCGALSAHSGRLDEARAFTHRLHQSLAGVETLVVNSSGCGSHLKDAGGGPAVLDAAELLASLPPRAELHPLELTVAYQDSCHLRHAQHLPVVWRPLLERIPGLTVVEPAEQDVCCGSAGTYNIVQAKAAAALGDRKAAQVLATGAECFASANPGCLVQVATALRRARGPLPSLHPVELLDASIRNVPAGDLLSRTRR
jgi:glycolate oxidase iron-sulfur subunit